MARNGAGTYNLPAGNPVVTGTTISSSWANNTLSDIASALTQSLSKDGQTLPTANLPMSNFKLTGLGAGTGAGDSLRYEQLFSQGVPIDIASASTVDIGGQTTAFLNITGNTTITSFGTNYNGPRYVKFADSLTLTHNSTTLVLPDGINLVTRAGDYCTIVPKSTITGVANGWAIVDYFRGSNASVNVASASTVDLNAMVSDVGTLTGSTTITAWTLASGKYKKITCPAGIQLTYNATTNNLNTGGTNYTTQTGDVLDIFAVGSVIYVEITTASGLPVISPAVLNSTNDPTFASTSSTQPTSAQWVNGKLALQPFTKSYASGEQTITTGGLLTFTHGLGAVPKLYYLNYVCKTAELNYSVNDKPQAYYWSSNSTGVFVTDVNATTITVRFGSAGGISLANKTTGTFQLATNANWRLEVTAYA